MDHSLQGVGRTHGLGFYMCSGDIEHFRFSIIIVRPVKAKIILLP